MSVWPLRLDTMESHSPYERRPDPGQSLTAAGLLGYLAVMAALLAIATAPLTGIALTLAVLIVALLVRFTRPRRPATRSRRRTRIVSGTTR